MGVRERLYVDIPIVHLSESSGKELRGTGLSASPDLCKQLENWVPRL